MATDREIVYAMNRPPQGTRAQYRSAVIRAAIDGHMCGLTVDWHHAVVQGTNGYHTFEMHRPLDDYKSAQHCVDGAMRSCWEH